MTPQQRAERSATVMQSTDAATEWAGIRVESMAPGQAVLSLIVQPHHLNGHGICHGGVIFTLADSAFAFACNSYNRVAVAQQNQITYLSPGQAGETLIAAAQEVSLTGRSGIYDVTVTGDGGRKVALFRGLSRVIRGEHFKEIVAG